MLQRGGAQWALSMAPQMSLTHLHLNIRRDALHRFRPTALKPIFESLT